MTKKLNIKEMMLLLPDFRQEGKVLHLLSDIVLTGLFTFLGNGQDYADMVIFGKEHGRKLKKYLKYPHGVPSHDTFSYVFSFLPPESLISILTSYSECFIDILSEKQINIDGKKLKGVSPKSRGNSGLYLVSAWVSENRLCVGQQKVKNKSSEISAIPALLSDLDIEGAVVSIDAAGCQTKIVEQICEQGGEYLIALKGNQGSLLEDVSRAFELDDKSISLSQWLNETNGSRKESRRCAILDAKTTLPKEQLAHWKDLDTLVRIETIREDTTDVRFYISNVKNIENINNPLYFNSLVRGHWGVENNLHWHLDVTFKEDKSRARNKNAPENLSILRKLALQLIENAKAHFKMSIAKIRYKISLNINSFISLLQFSCV